jgi:hypothetical protein
MRGYAGISLSLSACLHFVRNDEVDESLREIRQEVRNKGIVCGYVDYEREKLEQRHLANCFGSLLRSDHIPYGPLPWVEFLDDLIFLSKRVNGVVLVLDNADSLFGAARNDAFDMIEAFLIQFHHWFEKTKPCHLCFQLDKNDLIKQVFRPE